MKTNTANLQRHINKVSSRLIKDNPELDYAFNMPKADKDKLRTSMKRKFNVKKFNASFLKEFQGVFMKENSKIAKKHGLTDATLNAAIDSNTLTSVGVSQGDQVLLGLIDLMLDYIAKEAKPHEHRLVSMAMQKQERVKEMCDMFDVSSLEELDFPVFMGGV